MSQRTMRHTFSTLAALLATGAIAAPSSAHAQMVADLDPHVRATVASSPAPAITLRWNASMVAANFIVRRREVGATAWMQVAMLPADATEYVDRSVDVGRPYEYVVQRTTAMGSMIAPGFGYVIGGIDVAFRDDPGVVAVVVEAQTMMGAGAEVAQLEDDLRADGWTVVRVNTTAMTAPPTLRAELQRVAMDHSERFRAAILLGAVPRAFSGNINPDGHMDHQGAWPADGYYADFDGNWPDTRDYGGTNFNANRAGDGKFDPSIYPSPLEIAIGRVDAEGMPLFTQPPVELLRRYLQRNHGYRVGDYAPRPRTWVSDSFGYFNGEAFSRIAWRDGNALYGSDPESGRPFFDALEDMAGGYAFAFGCGGGNPQGAGGVGNSTDFTRRMPRAVFVGLFGSYFGDWSYQNNFLRAPLFSPSPALASLWFSRPTAHMHGLGAMLSFGDELLRSIQGSGYDVSNSRGQVHQALMGDPTLRMFTVRAPSMLRASGEDTGVALQWNASMDSEIAGYHVYRSAVSAPMSAATRLTMTPVMETNFRDTTAERSTEYRYRVVAVRKFTTGSGTFFNHSLGVFANGTRPVASMVDSGTASVADASADAMVVLDGSGTVGNDGGAPMMTPAGCACRAANTRVSTAHLNVWAVLSALVALSARRSRSRRARAGA